MTKTHCLILFGFAILLWLTGCATTHTGNETNALAGRLALARGQSAQIVREINGTRTILSQIDGKTELIKQWFKLPRK